MNNKNLPRMDVVHYPADISINDLHNPAWDSADPVEVTTYWSGNAAPAGRAFRARLLWTDSALYVRFEANRGETLVVSPEPDLSRKSMNLWERDVCELFIAPNREEPRRYFEFEISPAGEWLDVGIDLTSGRRVTDWELDSGMKAAAAIEPERVLMAAKIPWEAFGSRPANGDVWMGNLFRCVGAEPGRGYLAWSPTMTERPDFHVPEMFGEIRFLR